MSYFEIEFEFFFMKSVALILSYSLVLKNINKNRRDRK